MNGKTKAKWIVGVTGTIFSAFALGQFATGETASNTSDNPETVITDTMSEEEKELVQLDWSNFSTSAVSYSESTVQTSDRQTRRS